MHLVIWKYFIPHTWDKPRTVWEDVYLLPNDPAYTGEAIQLTVDALGDVTNPEHGSEREEFQKEALEKLGEQDYWIDASDMIIRQVDFSKEELLNGVGVFLEATGLPFTKLEEGDLDDFRERSAHADLIIAIRDHLNEG